MSIENVKFKKIKLIRLHIVVNCKPKPKLKYQQNKIHLNYKGKGTITLQNEIEFKEFEKPIRLPKIIQNKPKCSTMLLTSHGFLEKETGNCDFFFACWLQQFNLISFEQMFPGT